jgi:hypothetical protein
MPVHVGALGPESLLDRAVRKSRSVHENSRIPMIIFALVCSACAAERAAAQTVTYQPYIEPGNAGKLDESDQMVVAWQTNESAPHPGAYKVDFGRTASYGSTASVAGRVADSYLAADPSLPVPSQSINSNTVETGVSGIDDGN